MRWWKWVGLAGLIGAAAASVVVVQRRRARPWTDVSTENLRDALHARLAASRAVTAREAS